MAEPNWSGLFHALGSADDLPEILEKLSPDPSSPIWGELWDRVCHQGTTYPASPYVLPRLLEVAKSWVGAGRVMPLVLAADIVASREFNIRGFEATVEALHSLARETASAEDLTRSDRIYVLSSALTLGGERLWGPELIHLHDEEFPGSCTSCGVALYITISANGCFVSKEDPVRTSASIEEIDPCESADLPESVAWAHRTVRDVRDEELAKRICCVFGRSVCPACRTRFKVSEAIERFELG